MEEVLINVRNGKGFLKTGFGHLRELLTWDQKIDGEFIAERNLYRRRFGEVSKSAELLIWERATKETVKLEVTGDFWPDNSKATWKSLFPPLYRYRDPYIYSFDSTPELLEMTIVRTTPCGAWVVEHVKSWLGGHEGEKFVRNSARKRHAYPTRKEALDSFIIRKEKQLQHLHRTYQSAKASLEQANRMIGRSPKHYLHINEQRKDDSNVF